MSRLDYEVSRGNVSVNPGLSDAQELDIKGNLAIQIGRLIRKRGLTQGQAASILGVDQPRVSALMRGHLEKFSMEKLCDFVRALGCDVVIRIREKRKRAAAGRPGRLTIRVS
jgi:predicted XRE-type DNA-binding protein